MTLWTPCPSCGQPAAATDHDKGCPMTVSKQLQEIIHRLKEDSGYPYNENSEIHSSKAFAYGYAIGTLQTALLEWDRQLARGDPSGAI